MRTRVFSSTYPTWALVGGTSRPAGETVHVHHINQRIDTRYHIFYLLARSTYTYFHVCDLNFQTALDTLCLGVLDSPKDSL